MNSDQPLQVGDRVQVRPRSSSFDRPVWTVREDGTIVKIGPKRVHVQIGTAVITFLPTDLVLIQ